MQATKTQTAWLKCHLEPGMFPGEYAAEIDTAEAGRISLFASEEQVRLNEGLVRVELSESLEDAGASIVVYLPAAPFEISSRTVRVPRTAVIQIA